jgi:hypothetical protein
MPPPHNRYAQPNNKINEDDDKALMLCMQCHAAQIITTTTTTTTDMEKPKVFPYPFLRRILPT